MNGSSLSSGYDYKKYRYKFTKLFASVELKDKIVDFYHADHLEWPPALPMKLDAMARLVDNQYTFLDNKQAFEDAIYAKVRSWNETTYD
jgi:hypothetical protein